MEAFFIQDGKSIDILAGSAGIAAGTVVISGAIIGVTKTDIPANTLGSIALDGVYRMPVVSGGSITLGAAVYFNTDDRVCTAASSGATLIGVAVANSVDGAVEVKIN